MINDRGERGAWASTRPKTNDGGCGTNKAGPVWHKTNFAAQQQVGTTTSRVFSSFFSSWLGSPLFLLCTAEALSIVPSPPLVGVLLLFFLPHQRQPPTPHRTALHSSTQQPWCDGPSSSVETAMIDATDCKTSSGRVSPSVFGAPYDSPNCPNCLNCTTNKCSPPHQQPPRPPPQAAHRCQRGHQGRAPPQAPD